MRIATTVFLMGIAATTAQPAGAQTTAETATAVFAGGCFWCMEPPFDKLDGVLSTISGYVGGSAKDATYERDTTRRSGSSTIRQRSTTPPFSKCSGEMSTRSTPGVSFATRAPSIGLRSSRYRTNSGSWPRNRELRWLAKSRASARFGPKSCQRQSFTRPRTITRTTTRRTLCATSSIAGTAVGTSDWKASGGGPRRLLRGFGLVRRTEQKVSRIGSANPEPLQ